jgi:hypothetical protein
MQRAAGDGAAGGRAALAAEFTTVAVLDTMLDTWGDSYQITPYDGGWHWCRRDSLGGAEYAHTPDDLSRALAADHAFRPVRAAAT